jgi:diguanylate cyclase (GGDEF)-like protein/PAS domain S-box-containing protein
MNFVHRLRRAAPIGIAYFLAAIVRLFLAKLNDGVPFVWLPASIMIACLRVSARGDWVPTVFVCAIALFIVSGLLEGGWMMAGPMTAINMTEGLVGAWFLTRARPVAADLKNRTELLRAMQLSEQRYRLVAEYSDDILMHIELDGRIRYVSPSISRITGFEAADLNGSVARNLVVPEALGVVRQGYLATLAARGKTHSYEYLAKTTTGKQLWLETRGRALIDENGVIESTLCIIRDVTARKEAERELSDAALTDPLTGLPNRRSFEGEVKKRAAEAVPGESDCVAMFDIDRFKLVNDRFGHDAGDAVLQTFARVLRNVIRQDDIIARLGGEEFAVLFPCTEVPQALLVCERLREEMGRTLTEVGSQIIGVTVSGGVSMLGPRGLEHALKQADRALYTAKRGGRDQMALAA